MNVSYTENEQTTLSARQTGECDSVQLIQVSTEATSQTGSTTMDNLEREPLRRAVLR